MASYQDLLSAGVQGNLNPSQATEFENLLRSQGTQFKKEVRQGGTYIAPFSQAEITSQNNAKTQANLLAAQEAKTKDFLGRYTTGIAGARQAAETELGLPQLRQTTQMAGQTARDTSREVTDVLGSIRPTQEGIAKQVGISAPRLQQRIAQQSGEA